MLKNYYVNKVFFFLDKNKKIHSNVDKYNYWVYRQKVYSQALIIANFQGLMR